MFYITIYLFIYSHLEQKKQQRIQSFQTWHLHKEQRHDMMTSSNGKIFHVTGPLRGNSLVIGDFPSQRPVTGSFDVFFDLGLNKRLSKQSRRWGFGTPSRSLWRHCNGFTKHLQLFSYHPNVFGHVLLWWGTRHFYNDCFEFRIYGLYHNQIGKLCWFLSVSRFVYFDRTAFGKIQNKWSILYAYIMGLFKNTSNSGGRKWKDIFDHWT